MRGRVWILSGGIHPCGCAEKVYIHPLWIDDSIVPIPGCTNHRGLWPGCGPTGRDQCGVRPVGESRREAAFTGGLITTKLTTRTIVMSFLTAQLYDTFMARTEASCLQQWRRDLLDETEGEVLEIGAGTGANCTHYPAAVTRLVLSEPDRNMRRQLDKRLVSCQLETVEVISSSAEHLDVADESFDCVVGSLVCCSVTNLDACLREVNRVLRPGGSLMFLEHVAADQGTPRRKWQNVFSPIWKTVMGNCHLNRETEQAIIAAGFDILRIVREDMTRAPSIVRPTIRGVARKRSRD